jgi:hypothetical protein
MGAENLASPGFDSRTVRFVRSGYCAAIRMIIYIYIYIYNRNWVDTRWQQYVTHLHTNSTHNAEKGKFRKCGPCPFFASYTLAFALQMRKKHVKTSVRVAKFKNNEQYNTQKKRQ